MSKDRRQNNPINLKPEHHQKERKVVPFLTFLIQSFKKHIKPVDCLLLVISYNIVS